MKRVGVFALLGLGLLLTACAQPVDVSALPHAPAPGGFFWGLWNGLTLPFSFVGSLFKDDIAVYAVSNTGWPYDLGFFLGVGGFGASASVSR